MTWKEVRRAVAHAKVPLNAHTSTGLRTSPLVVVLGNGWSALGYSTDCVERASGQHAPQLLVVAEEASGVEAHAWEAIDSLKYRRLLAIGNPIRPDGRFVELIRQAERDRREETPDHLRVNAIQTSSSENPHADWDYSPVGLADRTWIDACIRRYGRESLWGASHIDAL